MKRMKRMKRKKKTKKVSDFHDSSHESKDVISFHAKPCCRRPNSQFLQEIE
jgi:hypothetical protein